MTGWLLRRRSERGSMVPVVVALASVLVLCTVGVAAAASVLVARRQAQSGADLAALAAAEAARKNGDPCGIAADTAKSNKVVVLTCEVEGRIVTLRISRETSTLLGQRFKLEVKARAGPK